MLALVTQPIPSRYATAREAKGHRGWSLVPSFQEQLVRRTEGKATVWGIGREQSLITTPEAPCMAGRCTDGKDLEDAAKSMGYTELSP